MADEYIKKKDIKEKVTAITGEWKDGPEFWVPIEAVLGNIDLLPAEDVTPVRHGHWIHVDYRKTICSICGVDESNFVHGTEDWFGCGESKFCPNCGVKMDGEIK